MLSLRQLYEEVKDAHPEWTFSTDGHSLLAGQHPLYLAITVESDGIVVNALDAGSGGFILSDTYSRASWDEASRRFLFLLDGLLLAVAMEHRL